jgi:hypothetical protein
VNPAAPTPFQAIISALDDVITMLTEALRTTVPAIPSQNTTTVPGPVSF